MAMRKVETTVDDVVLERLEADAGDRGQSKAELLRAIITEHYERASAPTGGTHDLSELAAKVEALSRYLCFTLPLGDTITAHEKQQGEASWKRMKEWQGKLRT
jgi:hypothetical protein